MATQDAINVKIEIELKSDVTPQKIKDWVVWETARIKQSKSYPSLIYIHFLNFLLTQGVMSEREAAKCKAVMGKVIEHRRQDLGLKPAQLARAANVTPNQVAKLESGTAAIAAYGGMFISIESYALMRGFADAVERMRQLMTRTPDIDERKVA